MDEKDWLYLQTIYNEKSITKAAQKLHISQPALTYRVNQLEKYFDLKIFIKGRRQIKITPEGEHIAHFAKKMSKELLKLKDQLQEMRGNIQGELRIGVSSNVVQYDLPPILKGFHHMYPNVNFKIQSDKSELIWKQLENEEHHIAMIRGDFDWDNPKLLLNKNQVCLISKDPINLQELPDLPRIRHKMDPATYKVDSAWWDERYSRPPYVFMEVDRSEVSKEMVIQGLGYSILPSYMIKQEERKDLFVLPLTYLNGEPFMRNLWALYHENDLDLTMVKAFVDYLKQHYFL